MTSLIFSPAESLSVYFQLSGQWQGTGKGSHVPNHSYARAFTLFFGLPGLCMLLLFMTSGPVLAATAENSVLKITAGHGPALQSGTAFYVRPNILATSYHIVQGSEAITVQIGEARIQITSILAYDPGLDLALLYMPLRGTPLPLDTEVPKPWTSLQSMGFARGKSLQKVSVLFQDLEKIHGVRHLCIQGSIQPGMSGGPVLNPQGRVVGMNRFVSDREQFFVPQAVEVRGLHQLLNQALVSPEFLDVKSFARRTSNEPSLHIKDQHIVITDN